MAAWCLAAVAPPPVVVGGEGVDGASTEGQAKRGDGVVAPGVWVRVPSTLQDSPPWFGVGRRDRTTLALNTGRA